MTTNTVVANAVKALSNSTVATNAETYNGSGLPADMISVIKGIKAKAAKEIAYMEGFLKNPAANLKPGAGQDTIDTYTKVYSDRIKEYKKIVSGLSAF